MAGEVGVMGHLCQAQEVVEEALYAQGVRVEGLAAVLAELAEQIVLGKMRKHLAGKVMCSLDIAAASWKGQLEKGSGLHWGSPLPSPYKLEYICLPFE